MQSDLWRTLAGHDTRLSHGQQVAAFSPARLIAAALMCKLTPVCPHMNLLLFPCLLVSEAAQ